MNNSPTLFFITGPIGVGKSTCLSFLFKSLDITGFEFISSDLYYDLYFKHNKGTEKNNYRKAKIFRDYKINKTATQRKSFIWESVLDNVKISTIEAFSKQGYQIIGMFVGTNELNLLIDRVKNRTLEDWYDIPVEKIKNRYFLMMSMLSRLSSISQIFIIVNSDSKGFKLVCYQKNDKIKFIDETCFWMKKFLPRFYQHSTKESIIKNREEKFYV